MATVAFNALDLLTKLDSTGDSVSLGIAGFKGVSRVKQVKTQSAEITENILESGALVNDYIINNPVFFTIEGVVSSYHGNTELDEIINQGVRNFGVVAQYLPIRASAEVRRLTQLGVDILNARDKVKSVINDANAILGINNSEDLQTAFMNKIDELHQSKELFKATIAGVDIPDLCIKSSTIERNNEIDALTFTLELQQFRLSTSIKTEKIKVALVNGTGLVKNSGDKNTAKISATKEASVALNLYEYAEDSTVGRFVRGILN